MAGTDHETWDNKADGIMTLLGYTLGYGTVIRTPYLVARNGGGAFFIPYIIFLVVCGLPVYYIEIVIGQYFQKGPVQVWNLSPAFKGLGVGACMIGWAFCTYSFTQFAWFFYCLYNSFKPTLPWASCDNSWNTANCVSSLVTGNGSDRYQSFRNRTDFVNFTQTASVMVNVTKSTSSAEEFWRLNTLSITDGLHNMGHIQTPLVICLAIVFFLFYVFMFKNIKIQGKVVYVTVILPVLLLTVFLIRGCMLPGAIDGILFYIKPDFEKLKDPKLWIESCSQAFASLGLAAGVVITSASHNHWHSNCLRFALIVCFGDLIVAVYTGFAVFSVLGYLAYLKDTTLESFRSSGYDIAFITLPETVANLPLPQLWSVLFYLTLITFGFDSTVPCLEILVRVLADQFVFFRTRRWLSVAIVIIPTFLVSVVYTFEGGIYVVTLVDWFIWGPPLTLFSVVEAFVIGWIFGLPRLSAATKHMYNRDTPVVLKILIKFVAPMLLLVVFIYSIYAYRPPQYGGYTYPGWANAVGWIISATIILPLPVCMCYTLLTVRGTTVQERLKMAFTPRTSICRHKREDKNNLEFDSSQPL